MITARRASALVTVALGLLVTLSGCGAASSAPAASPAAPAKTGAPAKTTARPANTQLVRLGAGFSPNAISLAKGQEFQLQLSNAVQARVQGMPARCIPGSVTHIANGMLSVQCSTASTYLYTAERPGSTVLTATVRPRCSPGAMCPQWVSAPKLTITVS